MQTGVIKKANGISKGEVAFIFHRERAGEYLEGYEPNDRIAMLTHIIITTKPVNNGIVTGWVDELEVSVIEPTYEDLIHKAIVEFIEFPRVAHRGSVDLHKIENFLLIDSMDITQIKLDIIKDVGVQEKWIYRMF